MRPGRDAFSAPTGLGYGETDENETDFEDMDGMEQEDDHGDIQNSAS